MTNDLLLHTMTLTKDRPVLSSDRGPHLDRTVTIKQELISSREPQMGPDTKTDWLTDRQSQCDFDLKIRRWKGAAIQRGLEPGGRGIALVRSRYQETSSNN
jgi:hypothetical protein